MNTPKEDKIEMMGGTTPKPTHRRPMSREEKFLKKASDVVEKQARMVEAELKARMDSATSNIWVQFASSALSSGKYHLDDVPRIADDLLVLFKQRFKKNE